MNAHFLAVDLGAESGRIMLGTVDGSTSAADRPKVAVEEIHRFANVPVFIQGTLRWNLPHLFNEIKAGLRKAAARGLAISGISTDAWGLDYVLLREREPMITLPFHYRDARTDSVMEQVFEKIPADEIFESTGIQFMSINTLYQLSADVRDRPDVLEWAERFLNIGDYFNYLLSGNLRGEVSIASTTQLYNPRAQDWAWELFHRLGFPEKIFPELVPPGSVLGPLLPEIAEETNLKNAQIVASCSHDTAAAVAAVPGHGDDWAFLSSGTWSLLGVELPAPVIHAGSRKFNFTNEAGFGGTTMFRKNIVGLWIVQECRRAWAGTGREFDYDELTRLAGTAEPLRSLIRPEDPRFAKAGRMPEKIADYCRETNQPVPENPGAMVRCVLESLALLYARTLGECESASGRKFRTLHIVGGGSKNVLLNQLTANAAQITVQAGPVEATAVGNILIQARALGHIEGDIRPYVRNSFILETFQPQNADTWQAASKRFESLAPPA